MVFSNREDFVGFLSQYFKFITTLITDSPGPKNSYFMCREDKDKFKTYLP
jgi:hypothetical protein